VYNEAIKDSFLESIENDGSRNTISYVFKASETTEKILGKDLYNFSIEEIGLVLNNMTGNSITTVRSNAVNIRIYITWCIQNGYRDNNLNPLDGYGNEWYGQFVDKTKKIHWAEDEFYSEIVEKLHNAQDQALLSLIFEGVLGKGFNELKEILEKHINWSKNEITIKRDGVDKTIKLSDRTMRYLDNAIKDKYYRTFSEKTGDYHERELISSGYLFKNMKSPRTREGEPLSLQVFYNRTQAIKDQFSMDYLTPNSIKQSGAIYHTYLLAKEKVENGEEPEIGYHELSIIGDKYNSSKMKQGDYTYYNTGLLKEYVSSENIKELYDFDVEIGKR
jgi:integrase